jgi:tagaturonate reductase
MQLSRQTIGRIDATKVVVPSPALFNLPERILQFGTGVLLRGLCDYYVDEANRNGRFNGRIVVVKSTSGGGTDEFNEQDNLYTICVRGMQHGKAVSENIVSSAISRVLAANNSWNEVLEIVQRPEMNIIISNTTEVGLQLVRESVFQQPPFSYPAKLLACLLARYKALGNDKNSRIIVIPT